MQRGSSSFPGADTWINWSMLGVGDAHEVNSGDYGICNKHLRMIYYNHAGTTSKI